MNGGALLRSDGLVVHYPVRGGVFFRRVGTNHAVDGVTLEVQDGETLGLVGESGCGKSTLARALLRLQEPTAGQVSFAGRDIQSVDRTALRALRREMQIVFQDPAESLNGRLTVGAILEEPFVIHDIGTPAKRSGWVEELLVKVGLPPGAANRFPHEFSGGQRQRIGIARAIALKPRLLICDEPVSALDVSIQSQILNLLLDLQREMGLAMLFIAHDLAVVKQVSDRIAVMYLGRIVETGAAESLYRQPLHPYTQALIRSIPKPDPAQRGNLQPPSGEVPSPINRPAGCHYHTRCPFVESRCRAKEPVLKPVAGAADSGRRVACHLVA